jgi:hypothetical protein
MGLGGSNRAQKANPFLAGGALHSENLGNVKNVILAYIRIDRALDGSIDA